jgi:hypothetical protein
MHSRGASEPLHRQRIGGGARWRRENEQQKQQHRQPPPAAVAATAAVANLLVYAAVDITAHVGVFQLHKVRSSVSALFFVLKVRGNV